MRGSIGYELPCFGVPVVTAGTGRYSGFDFTLDHDSAESYLSTLARLETVPRLDSEAVRRAKVHARALVRAGPWVVPQLPLRDRHRRQGPTPSEPPSPPRRATRSSQSNGDLDAFAQWAEDFVSIDYLAPAAVSQAATTQTSSKASV